MHESKLSIKDHLGSGALITKTRYDDLYQRSIKAPEQFWAEQAKKYITWIKYWDNVLTGDFLNNNVRWFSGAMLNVCSNCLDRHLPARAKQPAIIWEGDNPTESKVLTYQDLYEQVCRFANGLKSIGVAKGDRVCIYMPMIPEAAIAMLACARIGAIHSVVFAGFSAESLKNRIQDAQCSIVVTADASLRGGKITPLKNHVDEIIAECASVKKVIVVNNVNQSIEMNKHDIWYHELIAHQSIDCAAEPMEATEPLFILYTSGSTGKPKGILHGQGGYLLFATMSFQLVFNYQVGDVYWCTADIGWITGHSYLIYGPLASGATTLMFAGVPTYPSPSRFWEVVDKHHVNIFYTAPTAIRALIRQGDDTVKCTNRSSLKILGTVGEPINPEAWLWYYNTVGEKRCPIVDTWWQTETGGIMITPLPFATPLKPGSVSLPFFGVEIAIVDNQGNKLEGEATGNLVITQPWPGQLQTIYGDPARYQETYFSQYKGMYFTGDGVYRDKDGFYWITGRADDVIKISGHRLDTAEIESALVSHSKIAEAAVVGFPHEIKGQGIFVFVTPKVNVIADEQLKDELIALVRKKIGPIASPDYIQWTNDLPKTRSGKIMRRILRKIINGETEKLGDISTLANPETVQIIINQIESFRSLQPPVPATPRRKYRNASQ